MVWILAVIAVLLMFAPRAMRNIGLAILGAVFVVFLVIVILNRRPVTPTFAIAPPASMNAPGRSRKFDFATYEREKKDRDDPGASGRIALQAVRFGELRPVPGIEAGTLDAVRARLYNDSAGFTLTDYAYILIVQDCLPSQAADTREPLCTTVFERRDWTSTNVPASQARDVVIEIPKDPETGAPPFILIGMPRVELTPTDTRAYMTPDAR